MGGLLSWIGDLIGGLIGTAFVWLDNILGTSFFTSLIEPIMNFFGFEDEDIYNTELIAVKVFDEDLYNKMQKNLHLEYVSKGYGAIDYTNNFAKTGEAQFGKYYRTGKWDYLDYLPSGQITAVNIDRNSVEQALISKEGTNIFIIDIINRTPTDEVWAKFQLQELYDYNIGTDFLRYSNDLWYKYNSVQYITSNNTFNVKLDAITTIKAIKYEVIIVTVTSIDDTIDNKNTIVNEKISYINSITGDTLYIVETTMK